MVLIVNADDFGMSHEKNVAIDTMMRAGICTNASLVVNMPFFDEAVLMAKQGGYLNRLSLHINLTVGDSVGQKIRKVAMYYEEGEFVYAPIIKKNRQILPFHIRAIRDEIEQQIQRFIGAGLKIQSIDSHNWVHLRVPVWLALKPLIKKYNIKVVRPMWDGYKREEIASKKWSKYFRFIQPYILKAPQCKVYAYSSNIEQFLLSKEKMDSNSIVEVFTHPDYVGGSIMDMSSSYTKQPRKGVEENVSYLSDYKKITVKEVIDNLL